VRQVSKVIKSLSQPVIGRPVVMHDWHHVYPTNFMYFSHVVKSFMSLSNEKLKVSHVVSRNVSKNGLEILKKNMKFLIFQS